MTAGVVEAWEALRPELPVFFSIHGTGQDEARALVVERLGIETVRLHGRCRACRSRGSRLIVRSSDRVVVHGLTGREGSFWAARMREYGTNVVAGVSPTKAGTVHDGIPVFASAQDAAADVGIDVSVFFVPPVAALGSAHDAIDAGARTLVLLTEFVPVHDTMEIVELARRAGAVLVGPNTAGVVTPGEAFAGFMPAFDSRLFTPGSVGVVSRSGSLGTLACLELTRAGLGQSGFIGVGGDPVSGTSTAAAVSALAADERDRPHRDHRRDRRYQRGGRGGGPRCDRQAGSCVPGRPHCSAWASDGPRRRHRRRRGWHLRRQTCRPRGRWGYRRRPAL